MNLPQNCYRVSVKAIIKKHDKVLLTHEKEGWWSFPGGGVDHGETLETALKRELKEELDMDLQKMDKLPVYINFDKFVAIDSTEGEERLQIFFGVELANDELYPSSEVLDAQYFSKDEIAELALSPLLDKEKTKLISAIFK